MYVFMNFLWMFPVYRGIQGILGSTSLSDNTKKTYNPPQE